LKLKTKHWKLLLSKRLFISSQTVKKPGFYPAFLCLLLWS
jgi:hypothetical protein